MASSFSFAEEMSLLEAKKYFGNYEVSCQEMTLVKSLGQDNPYSKMEVLKFDKSKCEKFLSHTPINSIIEPVLKEFVDANADHSQDPVIDVEKQKQIEETRLTQIGKAVHKSARHLADACKSSAAGREKNQAIFCYFGGPKLENSAAFKAIFKAMLDDSLPDLETICSAEPLAQITASGSLFKGILPNRSSMTWNELQSTLQSDGFACGEDRCIRNVMGIIIPGSTKLREQLQLRPKEFFLLLPRYLTIYRGDWRVTGPSYNGCLVDKSGKKSGHFCDGPSNGVLNGICLAKEDFHTWYGFGYILNYDSSDWAHEKP
jgi:hypothetical protein